MMRATTRKQRVFYMILRGGDCGAAAEAIATLPVAAKDEAKKKALMKELDAFTRQEDSRDLRAQRAREVLANKLDKLAIEKKLVK